MKNKYLRVGSAAVLTTAFLVGCGSAPTESERSARAVAKSEAGQKLSAAELGAATPVSDAAMAAAQTDNFWETGLSASNDDGHMTYSTKGAIVDDPTYNRAELKTYEGRTTGSLAASGDSQIHRVWGPKSNEVLLRQLDNNRRGGGVTMSAPARPAQQVIHTAPPAPRPAPKPTSPQPKANDN